MANIHDCLQRAIDGGEIDPVRGRAAQSEFEQLVARFEGTLPRAQAEAEAARALKEATRANAASRRHMVIAQMQAMVRLNALILNAPDPAVAIRNLLEKSDGSGFTGESVQSLQNAIIKSVNTGLQEFLRTTGRTIIGTSRDPAMLRNIIRERHGQATDDLAAKAIAQAVGQQQERLRQLFNAHGGNIGKLEDFGVSHSHNVTKIRAAGFDAWSAAVTKFLAWHRIVDFKTGRPFAAEGAVPSADAAAVFLRDVWDGITSRGWDDRAPSMAVGGKALYNQRAEHRVLHFRDGDAWMDYNLQFGTSDPFTAVVGGLHGMARDIAQMRVLGPNPRMGLEFASQVAMKKAAELRDQAMEDAVTGASRLAKTMLSHLDGSSNMPVNVFWASFFGGTRSVLTSIQLGSAPLSATTDLATISMASKAVGMNPANVLARAARLMASSEERAMLAASGYVADGLADMGAASARYTGNTYAPEIAERLSSVTMRASGLAFWTDMNKLAFQGEFTAMLGTSAAKSFDQLHPELRQLFTQRGITPADWDLLRHPDTLFQPRRSSNGAPPLPGKADPTFINPFHWLEHTSTPRAEAEGLSMRLQMLIEEQLEFAVPTASLEGRSRMLGQTRPGTFEGELLRSTTMYKGFALSLTLGQIRRFASLPKGDWSRAKYAAQMGAGLILLGAVAVQLKEMAKGRDPRPMDEGKFLLAALFQSGGLGIFGDFFASETSRAGGGLAETVAGPVVGFASDLLKPVASNVMRMIEGKETTLGRDAANLVRYNTPVLSSLWYSRLAFDRMVADQLQSLLDPDAEAAFRRQEQQRQRDYGSATWWQRGTMAPQRAPDLTNIAGAPQ
jgi:hypothetical protein